METKKRYMIDTSVIIDSPENLIFLYQNGENELFINDVVLKELNGHKEDNSGNEKGYTARNFVKAIDQGLLLSEKNHVVNQKLHGKGHKKGARVKPVVSNAIRPKNGDKIHIFQCIFEGSTDPVLLHIIKRDKYDQASNTNDLKIAEIADSYNMELITNDIYLKIIALSAGIESSSMKKDRVDSPEHIEFSKTYTTTAENFEAIKKEILKKERIGNQIVFKETIKDLENNKGIEIQTGKEEYFLVAEKELIKIESEATGMAYKDYRIKPLNVEQKFYLNLLRKNNGILVVTGSTGSGKTLMALQEGLRRVKDPNDKIDGIVYMRNTVTANDHVAELGFRKGDQDTKLGYFAYPLFGAINFILENSISKEKAKLDELSKNNKSSTTKDEHTAQFMADYNIEVMDIAHARGITISNKFIIFDELQNAPLQTLKLIGTRIGKESVLVLMGDFLQVDHPYLTKNRNALVSMLQKAQKDSYISAIQLKQTIRSKTAEWFQKNI